MSSFVDAVFGREEARKIYFNRSQDVDKKIITAAEKDTLARYRVKEKTLALLLEIKKSFFAYTQLG